MTAVLSPARAHVDALVAALGDLDTDRLDRWGAHLGTVLLADGRLLVAANGGSAAQAQHLSAELVGRYREERRPLAAIALHTDTSALTAIGNDYGYAEVFARQVRAHGQAGDVLLALSTSGRSANVLRAVEEARTIGLTTWALTGRSPNPLAAASDDTLAVEAAATATVQEVHQVAIHLMCTAIDRVVRR